jgi:CRP-like cAMP-binding protein
MPQSALAAFLKRLRLRSELGSEEGDAILNLGGRVEQRARRDDIVLRGDRTTHACLIVEGLAARYDQTESGARQYTALHISGDMCDLHSVILPVAAWGIEALNPVTILRVAHKDLLSAAEAHPAIGRAFWRDTTADGGIFAKWAANLGGKPARARLAHLICEIGTRMEHAGLGTRTDFPITVTQDQLADALGLTPVHVNRTLQALRAERLVRTGHKRIEVLDWDGLTACADFQEDYLQFVRDVAPAPEAAFYCVA